MEDQTPVEEGRSSKTYEIMVRSQEKMLRGLEREGQLGKMLARRAPPQPVRQPWMDPAQVKIMKKGFFTEEAVTLMKKLGEYIERENKIRANIQREKNSLSGIGFALLGELRSSIPLGAFDYLHRHRMVPESLLEEWYGMIRDYIGPTFEREIRILAFDVKVGEWEGRVQSMETFEEWCDMLEHRTYVLEGEVALTPQEEGAVKPLWSSVKGEKRLYLASLAKLV